MQQIRFPMGLGPRPRCGSLQRSQRPHRFPSWILGVLLLRGGKGGEGGEKKDGDGERKGGRGGGEG